MALLSSSEVEFEEPNGQNPGTGTDTGIDWESVQELAVVVAPKAGKPLDPKFVSHQFNPRNMIMIPRRISPKDFECKLSSICSCPNLRVLCMYGLGELLNKEKVAQEFLIQRLASSCPHINHFILDEGLLDIAIAYQESLNENISVIEVRLVQSETEDGIIHLVTSGRPVESVHLDHSSIRMIEQIVPVVKSLSLCWITDQEFQSLIKCCPSSHITELRLETVDLPMNVSRISQLASVLPRLQLIKLSAQMEHMGSLKHFPLLRHVIFDAECDSKPAPDPFFPIDMSRALELNRQLDTKETVVKAEESTDEGEDTCSSMQSPSSQKGLEEFLIFCGHNLSSFTITIRDKFKKDLFQSLKKCCPKLQELTILSITEQFFDTKSLSLPSLRRLRLQLINMNDAKLVELLDHCRYLQFISIDKPRKLTRASIQILKVYSEDIFADRDQLSNGLDKFTAIVLTEGKEELSKDVRTSLAEITYRQTAVIEVSNRLRYKY